MDTQDDTQERWLPVVGYEGLYEVSDQGRVRSLEKKVVYKDGRTRVNPARLRNPKPLPNGRFQLKMVHPDKPDRNILLHRMVLEAFVGPCPEGMEALHENDNPQDNRLVNLRWGTRSENQLDRVKNGRHHNASKTHCMRGHEFTPENTRTKSRGRSCRTCENMKKREKRSRKIIDLSTTLRLRRSSRTS